MINLIKESDPMYTFKVGLLKDGCDYDIRVCNIVKTYKYTKPNVPPKIAYSPVWLSFSNVFRKGNRQEPGERFEPCPKKYISDIGETISFDAEDYVKGDVRIKEHGTDNWFTVEEFIDIKRELILDDTKIFPGQIWSLTVDDDPRFKDTIIQIASVSRWDLLFNFQRKVVYRDGYERVELIQGKIDYKPHVFNKETNKYEDIEFDFNKVHLDILMNKETPTETIDRSQPDKFRYPYAYTGWCVEREDIPYTPFEERKPIDLPDEFE